MGKHSNTILYVITSGRGVSVHFKRITVRLDFILRDKSSPIIELIGI